MQKGTVCGADRSVYKLNFFFLDLFLHFFVLYFLSMFHICKGLAGTFV